MVDILSSCNCSYLAKPSLTFEGNEPSITAGKLGIDSGVTDLPIGAWVYFDGTDWKRVDTTTSLTSVEAVGVIRDLKHFQNGSTYVSVDVSTIAFLNALIWTDGGGKVDSSTTKIWDTDEYVSFAPLTHTGLASKLAGIFPVSLPDGSGTVHYFTFK